MCEYAVPVNTRVDVAIAAHRLAFEQFYRDGCGLNERTRTAAMYALRAVILARTPEPNDYRQMLDYLTGLPIEAWSVQQDHSPASIRGDTLRAISRNLTFATID
jgi:hypothetical protein